MRKRAARTRLTVMRRALLVVGIALPVAFVAATVAAASNRYDFRFGPASGDRSTRFALRFTAPAMESSSTDRDVVYNSVAINGPGSSSSRCDVQSLGFLALPRRLNPVFRINGQRQRLNTAWRPIQTGDHVSLAFEAPSCLGRYAGWVRFTDAEAGGRLIGVFSFTKHRR